MDEGAAADILVLARRDAPRVGAADIEAADIAERLADGLQLVWITARDMASSRADLLAASGIVIEALPQAST